MAKYLEWFNGLSSKVDRRTQAPVFILRAAVWITGCVQPKIFWRSFPENYIDNGFLSRFLLALPPTPSGGWSDATISQATANDWARLIRTLRALTFVRVPDSGLQVEVAPLAIRMTDEARARFMQFCNSNARDVQAEADPATKAAFAKMTGYAAKFALIDHLVRRVPLGAGSPPADGGASQERVVGLGSVETAIALAEWFKHETRRIYRMRIEMSSNETENRQSLLDFVGRRGGKVTVAQVLNNFSRFHDDKRRAKDALDALVAEGLGGWTKQSASGGGPRAEYFVLRAS